MLPFKCSYGPGYSATAPTERSVFWRPRQWQRGGKIVASAQGSHGFSIHAYFLTDNPVVEDEEDAVEAFLTAGMGFIQGDMAQGPDQGTFGSDTGLSRFTEMVATVRTKYGAAGPVGIYGASGGAPTAIRYALANPADVAAIGLVVPMVDTRATYDLGDVVLGATGLEQAEFHTAYGVANQAAFYAALPTRNPMEIADLTPLAGIPIRLYYSTDDPFIPVAGPPAFAARVNAAGGDCSTISMGAQQHGLNTGFDWRDLAVFLRDA